MTEINFQEFLNQYLNKVIFIIIRSCSIVELSIIKKTFSNVNKAKKLF